MKITRERTEILLMEYAAGALDESCALLVASYITLCPKARSYVQQCETYGGTLMEHDCSPVAMHENSLLDVLDRLDDECREQKRAKNCCFCKKQALPHPIANHINESGKRARWRRISPGICFCNLAVTDDCYSVRLIKMAPNAKMPLHNHPGMEITLVLQGGYRDEFGEYQAGDLVIIEENISHNPVADENGCICLVVTDAPIHFTGSFGALLNMLMR